MTQREADRGMSLMRDPLEQLVDHAPLPMWREMAARAIVARANWVWPERPDRLPAAMVASQRWGVSLPGGVAASTARYPNAAAVIDEDGTTTYSQLWRRSNALAAALAARGVGAESKVGLL